MLDFFRRYQRYFFIVVAVVIIISFSFFGTQATLNSPQKVEDRSLGQAIDGSKIMKSEVDRMVRFIWSDRGDITLTEKGVMPNFFNDGVIRKDLIGTGIGTLLVHAYFDELKGELQDRMTHHKRYRPYVHPTAPFISVENLWGQVLPAQKMNLERFLKETEEMTPETFSLLVDLYLGETAFPPNTLREYLMFQEKHYHWIQRDPALQKANLGLFQCRSIEDWFGSQFVQLMAQFIINSAAYAKERGYKVSYEEARVDLIRNGYESLQVQMRKPGITEEEVGTLWQEELRYLGMREKEAVNLWQKVMLFRRLFEDVGGAVFVDPHVYQTFYGFASKIAEVDLYHLPEAIELKDFSSLMKLEFYLDQVAKSGKDTLTLPQNFASVEEVEATCPELIEQRFLVEVGEVHKDEIALNVSLKEMWEWQLEKENYELLEKEFPQLALKKGVDAEGYFAALEGIDSELRLKIDKFSRGKIVDLHPEWIGEALNQKDMNIREVNYSPNGANRFPFEGKEIIQLFTKAALKGELAQDPVAIKARKSLEQFTADGETYYRFHVLDRDLTKTLLTFAEANERGILDSLLEKYLEESYSEIRTKNPALFKTEENIWKPFKEVKDEVGRQLYSDTLKNLESEVSKLGVKVSEDRYENLDSFYPHYRLFPFMSTAQQDIRKLGNKSHYLKADEEEGIEGKLRKKSPLESQWSLVKEARIFKNHEKSDWFSSDIFAMVEKSWSEVSHSNNHRLLFFQLQEKSVPNGNFSKEMKEGQSILSKEAKRYLMGELLDHLKEKEAIHLDHDSPERT